MRIPTTDRRSGARHGRRSPGATVLGALSALLLAAAVTPAQAFVWDPVFRPGDLDFAGLCTRPASVMIGSGCPATPTIAHCTDPRFLAGACGQPYVTGADPRCDDLINDRETLCLLGRDVLPMMSYDTNEDVDGVLDEFGDDAVTYAGMHGTYAGEVVGGRARRADGDGAGLGDALVREWWAENCSVQSCEEYLFEKYYDLAEFERYAGTLGDDYRAIFEAAYGAAGIARRHIRGYAGSSVGWIEPSGTHTYKNEFFSYRPWEHPVDWFAVAAAGGFRDVYGFDALGGVDAFFSGCSLVAVTNTVVCDGSAHPAAAQAAVAMNAAIGHYDAAFHGQVEPALPSRYPPPAADAWDWHRSMSDALAGVSDERLLWLAELQDEFATLRDEHVRLRAQIAQEVDAITLIDAVPDDVAATLNRPGHVRTLRTAIARSRFVETRLGALLQVAEANGCLDLGTTSPCDWSPQWLAEDVFGLLTERRAADYQRCIDFTGNRFDRLWDEDPNDAEGQWLVEWAEARGDFCVQDGEIAPGCAIRDSYIGDERTVDLYFSTVEAWFDSLAFPVDPETGAPILGESAADEGRQGESLFDIDYDYDFGWRMTELTAPDLCDLGLATSAGAHIDATAFGVRSELLGATITAEVNAPDGAPANSVGLGVTVLGVDLYTEVELPATAIGGRSYRFNVLEEPAASDGVSTQKTFYVGWVPFTFQAGMAGSVGVRIAVDAEAELCDPDDIDATFAFSATPYANVGAFASGALGVPGVSLGVRADLTLVDLRLPFEAELGLSITGDRFTSRAHLDAELELLRGSVSLVAELLVKTYRRRLFGWPGVEWATTLLANGFDFELGLVRAAAGAGGRSAVEIAPMFADVGSDCHLPREVPAPDYYADFNDDNVSGATVAPQIGQGPLALDGDAVAGREGVFGQAVAVFGAGAVLSTSPAPPSAATGAPFSLSFWAWPDGLGAGTLLSRGDATTAALTVETDTDGHLNLTARCASSLRGRGSDLPLRDRRWNHVVVTYEPDGGHLVAWANGAQVLAIAGCALEGSTSALALGRTLGTAAPRPFTGRIDELAIWTDVVLGRADVYELFDRGAGDRPVHGEGAAVPQGVTDFVASSGDGDIRLDWTNPPSLAAPNDGYSEVEVRFSTDHAPRTVSEGERLVRTSILASAVHSGLAVGQVVHYTIFLHRIGAPAVRGPSVTGVVAFELPGPVTGVAAVGGAGRVDLTWTNPTDRSFWRVRVMRGVDATPPSSIQVGFLVCEGRVTSCVDADVAAGREYTYAIFSLADGYLHGAPAVARATTLDPGGVVVPDFVPPGPVTGLIATGGDGSATLRWTPPAAPDFDHVVVQRASEGGWTLETLPVRPTTNLTDSGLTNGIRYFYAVSAVDRAGNVGPAVSTTATPSAESFAAPEDFAAVGSLGGIALSWTPPAGASVRIVRSRVRSVDDWRSGSFVYAGSAASFEDRAVRVGETWHYSAFTVVGDRTFGPARASASPIDVPPGPVTDLAVVPDVTSVAVSWTNPADEDFARIDLRYSSVEWPTASTGALATTGLTSSTVVTGLAPDRLYYLAVFAFDRAGQASEAARVAVRTLPLPDDPPGPVTDLVVTPGERDAAVRWTLPADADFDRVELRLAEAGPPGPGEGALVYSGAGTTTVVGDLAFETTYHLAAYAYDVGGNPSVAATATFTTVDLPPGPVTAVDFTVASTSAELYWTNPDAPDFDHVEVRRSTVAPPGPAEGEVVFTGAVSGILLSNLTPSTEYHHTIFAFDAAGHRSEGASVTFSTLAPDDVPPGPVTDLVAVPADTSAALTWTMPPDDDLQRVEVRYGSSAAPPPTGGTLAYSGLGTATTLSGLTPETHYFVSVYPYDNGGQLGAQATTEFTTTPGEPPGIDVVVPAPRAVFVGETVQVRANYTLDAGVAPPDTFTWEPTGAVPVGIDAPVDPFDAYLTFTAAGTATVDLTVSNGVESGAGTLTFEVAPWTGPANDVVDHPFAAPVAAPAGVSLAADDANVYALEGFGAGNPRTFQVFDGVTREERSAFEFDGAELVGAAGGRVYAFNETHTLLQVVEVSDPAMPALLDPWAIGTSGAFGWAVAGDTVVAIQDFGGTVLVLARTPTGLASAWTIPLADGRRATHLALGHGGAVVYVALQPEPMQAPALWAYDLDAAGGPARVATMDLGEASETGGEAVTGLGVGADRLVAALDPDYQSRRFVLVDISDPGALTPVRAPDTRFGYAQRLRLVGETLYCSDLDPRRVVATVDLGTDSPTVGDFFPGPSPGAGDYALFPASAPTALWIAALAGTADRAGEAGVHVFALDAPRAAGDSSIEASARGAVAGDGSVFVVAADDGLRLYDPNASPFDLVPTGSLPHAVFTGGGFQKLEGLALQRDVLFVVEPGDALGDLLRTVDVSDRASPVELDTLELGKSPCGHVFPIDGRVIVGCEMGGFVVVDTADPAALTILDSNFEAYYAGFAAPETGRGAVFTGMGTIVRYDFAAADPFATSTSSETGIFEAYPFLGTPLWTSGDLVWLSHGDGAERWDLATPTSPVVGPTVAQANEQARAWRFVAEHGVWANWGRNGLELNRLVGGAPTSVRTAHLWPRQPLGVDVVDALSVHASRFGVPDSGGRAALWRPVGTHQPLNEYATGSPGQTLTYTLLPTTLNGASGACLVTGGTCDVSANAGGVVTMHWTLPTTPGEHEITFVAGDPTFFVTTSDRLRVEQGAP